MIVTFVAMLLSGMGQPALLYLVPFTVVTSAVVAGCRGEMKQFWAGTTYKVSEADGFSTVVVLDSFDDSYSAVSKCFHCASGGA